MKQKLFNLISIIFLFTASSCSENQMGYEKKGYTVKVTYDLGEGIYNESNRDTHTLYIYYKPNSPITDFADNENLKNGDLELEGFYFDSSYTQKLDINNYVLGNENITLYAKWKSKTVFTFDIYYQKDGETNFTLLENYVTQANTAFNYKNSKIKYPSDETYTFIEAYQDENMTIPVDSSYVLTEDSSTKSIYTKWIKGSYKVINTANEFALNWGNNLYINKDLDLTNKKISYNILENVSILGNNHTLSNLTISTNGRDSKGNAIVGGLFKEFNNSVIKDLTLSNVKFTLDPHLCSMMYFTPFGESSKNSTIDNVKITGTYEVGSYATKNEINISVYTDKFFYSQENCLINNSTIELNKGGE